MSEKKKEPFIGGVINKAGSSLDYKTGDWKTFHPEIDFKKCTNCLTCSVFCPENCIKVKQGKISHIDMNYCKGCGICATECPFKAIVMKKSEVCSLED